ncbi:hypothetical protein BGZ51_008295 [Haplosporangium sp. Z 767]|nr:hypothetical protein BGZ51_008295 [Haplosporangium sp. Z 767]
MNTPPYETSQGSSQRPPPAPRRMRHVHESSAGADLTTGATSGSRRGLLFPAQYELSVQNQTLDSDNPFSVVSSTVDTTSASNRSRQSSGHHQHPFNRPSLNQESLLGMNASSFLPWSSVMNQPILDDTEAEMDLSTAQEPGYKSSRFSTIFGATSTEVDAQEPSILKRKPAEAFGEDDNGNRERSDLLGSLSFEDSPESSLIKGEVYSKACACQPEQQQEQELGYQAEVGLPGWNSVAIEDHSQYNQQTPERLSKEHGSLDVDFVITPTARIKSLTSEMRPRWSSAGRRAMMQLKYGRPEEDERPQVDERQTPAADTSELRGDGAAAGSGYRPLSSLSSQSLEDYIQEKGQDAIAQITRQEQRQRNQQQKLVPNQHAYREEDIGKELDMVIDADASLRSGNLVDGERQRVETLQPIQAGPMERDSDIMSREDRNRDDDRAEEASMQQRLEAAIEAELQGYQESSFDASVGFVHDQLSPSALVEELSEDYVQHLTTPEELELLSWMYEEAQVARRQRIGVFAPARS